MTQSPSLRFFSSFKGGAGAGAAAAGGGTGTKQQPKVPVEQEATNQPDNVQGWLMNVESYHREPQHVATIVDADNNRYIHILVTHTHTHTQSGNEITSLSIASQLSTFEAIDLEDLDQLLLRTALIWTSSSMPISQWTWTMRLIYLISLIWTWMTQMMIFGSWKRYHSESSFHM